MQSEELKYILEELRFTAAFPAPVIERIASDASLRQANVGEFIFREGLENHDLFLVRRGRIALEMNIPGRGSVRILTLGTGEMVGWSALLGQGRMTASAVVVDDVDLIVSHADMLLQECELSSEFGYHLMRQMANALARRLLATRLQLLDLFAETPAIIVAARPGSDR